jgi:hypothetical protein
MLRDFLACVGFLKIFIGGDATFHPSEHGLKELSVPLDLAIVPVCSGTGCVPLDVEPLKKGCELITVQFCSVPESTMSSLGGPAHAANPVTINKLNHLLGLP